MDVSHQKRHHILRYIAHNVGIVLALVLIWRGIWYMLDGIDYRLFGGTHFVTALAGAVIGVLILYIPDKDLKEIEKL